MVESSEIMVDDAEVTKSNLLMPISKEIEIGADKSVGKRTFYLADTEAFEGPVALFQILVVHLTSTLW